METALDGVEGERLALTGGFDAVVLDLMLPGRSGLEILASVRTAAADAAGDRADRARRDRGSRRGTRRGRGRLPRQAVLAGRARRARARAAARRSRRRRRARSRAEGIEVDLLTRKVQPRRAPRCPLDDRVRAARVSPAPPRRRSSRASRSSAPCGATSTIPRTNVVDVYVGYLRRKLGRPSEPAPISTVRAVGYRLGSGELSVSADSADACAPRGLRWRLAAWVAVVTLAVHRGSRSSRSTAAPPPSCATRSTSELARRRARARRQRSRSARARAHRRDRRRRGRLRPRPAVQRQLDAAVRADSRRGHGAPTGPSCSPRAPPDNGETPAEQAAREPLSRAAARASPTRLLDARRCPTSASCACSSARCTFAAAPSR